MDLVVRVQRTVVARELSRGRKLARHYVGIPGSVQLEVRVTGVVEVSAAKGGVTRVVGVVDVLMAVVVVALASTVELADKQCLRLRLFTQEEGGVVICDRCMILMLSWHYRILMVRLGGQSAVVGEMVLLH
jgi:hypothetical protein